MCVANEKSQRITELEKISSSSNSNTGQSTEIPKSTFSGEQIIYIYCCRKATREKECSKTSDCFG